MIRYKSFIILIYEKIIWKNNKDWYEKIIRISNQTIEIKLFIMNEKRKISIFDILLH